MAIKKLRIAQISPLWIPTPPFTYGGTEFVVSLLTEELKKRGHKVTLFATGDSKTSAKLIPIWPKSLWRARLKAPHAVYGLLYHTLLSMQQNFDIIHDHCEFYTAPFSNFFKTPIVSTLHHPMYEELVILYKKFPKIHYVAISKNQKRSAPGINFSSIIYNGIPIEKYKYNEKPKNYLLWLSKITPEKGLLEAIRVAQMTNENLVISGVIPKEEQDFFNFRIKPLIDGQKIKFVGASNFKEKIELFKEAKGFLFPVKREEPFGLVVIEAQACGTPVIAFKRGAMTELIKDKKTGFLVSDEIEMAKAVKKINQIKRKQCRNFVEKKFSVKKMVNKYEQLYYKILKEKK